MTAAPSVRSALLLAPTGSFLGEVAMLSRSLSPTMSLCLKSQDEVMSMLEHITGSAVRNDWICYNRRITENDELYQRKYCSECWDMSQEILLRMMEYIKGSSAENAGMFHVNYCQEY